MRHIEAYQYVRLMWRPQKGDRVRYQGRRFRVQKAVKGKGIKLEGRPGFLYPGEVTWRPTPRDFDAVLFKARGTFVYHQLLDGNRQLVGISCNGRTIPVRGRPVQILSQMLSLRAVDSNLSVTINRIFENSFTTRLMRNGKRESNAVRLHLIKNEQEDSGST